MTIAILPARLANQIAAGEVVERPASVVKELVENSLDAGATNIRIDIEKGGAKRIRIIDNGKGINKDELALALSRHATSKIKDLDDLESISSLGFRGEALASISSVARLTLTSKPQAQESAWQANAQGRDMSVTLKPAAHPNGTTIDVSDLFFNTPARRKFLRTEKTEFGHIEEVIKRIALTRFDVSFVLTHNHKIIKQFRLASSSSQRSKRVAQVCGQKFVDNALEVDCQHDGFHLQGWIAQPSFYRPQNDLSYSYVNGRMMRDKLINHAIRQAYANLLPNDGHPAFVLFLKLDFREVDVNVHPAKHEVRFHQGRYVHDFIYSVCQQALTSTCEPELKVDNHTGEILTSDHLDSTKNIDTNNDTSYIKPLCFAPNANAYAGDGSTITEAEVVGSIENTNSTVKLNSQAPDKDNLAPASGDRYNVSATHLGDKQEVSTNYDAPSSSNKQGYNSAIGQYPKTTHSGYSSKVTEQASKAYSDLMTPLADDTSYESKTDAISTVDMPIVSKTETLLDNEDSAIILHWLAPCYFVIRQQQELRLLSIKKLDLLVKLQSIKQRWHEKLISQPLLLPVKITASENIVEFVQLNEKKIQHVGMEIRVLNKTTLQIRQFPALLRNKDVLSSFDKIINRLQVGVDGAVHSEIDWQLALAELMLSDEITQTHALKVWQEAKKHFNCQFEQQLRLNSVALDLTFTISLLEDTTKN